MASLPIPDELMGEILLRLPTPADLVRASAACVFFRRVAADRSFLRRYRKLHTAPLLGFLARKVFHPATPPYPSASAASAVALAADFSFSFLPAPAIYWAVKDIRDGRVLLKRPMHSNSAIVFPEVVVCDPLYRRYLLLPPIPAHLAASVEDPFLSEGKWPVLQIFLAPAGDGEEADETSFRVIWMAQCKARLVAFVFSSTTRQWRAIPSPRWLDLSADMPLMKARNRFFPNSYVYGSFYLATSDLDENKLLVLDIKTMEFSIHKPPLEANGFASLAMVEAGEGRAGMLVSHGPDISYISYFIRQIGGGSSSQWQQVKTILLKPLGYPICNMEKYPLLYQVQSSLHEEGCFRLDIKTSQLEKVCALQFDGLLRSYSNFPPSLLSSPTISSGVENRAEEMLEQGFAARSSAELPPSE